MDPPTAAFPSMADSTRPSLESAASSRWLQQGDLLVTAVETADFAERPPPSPLSTAKTAAISMYRGKTALQAEQRKNSREQRANSAGAASPSHEAPVRSSPRKARPPAPNLAIGEPSTL